MISILLEDSTMTNNDVMNDTDLVAFLRPKISTKNIPDIQHADLKSPPQLIQDA